MRLNSKQFLAALIAFAVGAAGAAEATRPGDKPLVVNGDLSLTTIDFDAYMQRVPPDRRDEFRAEFEKINPTVDGLWVRRVMAARAEKAGLDKDPVLQARIRLAKEDLLAEAYMLDVANKAKVPNLEPRARELYKAHLKDFTSPELITGQHILVSVKNYPPDIARQRAQEVYERAKSGEDFAKLAAQYTDNPASIEINGMPLSSFAAPLPDAVSKLKAGEIMAPVETQFGFHIIKMGDRIPPQTKPFEQVRDDLIAMEKQKFVDEEKTAVVEAIRADPKTTLMLENVRGLKSDFKMPSAEEIAKIKPNIRY
jgi:peptidyl-prolyl cis-trans isomerase C